MKSLRETLNLVDAVVVNMDRVVTKDGYTLVLNVKGPLTPELADVLRCRNQAFNLNDQPYRNLKSFTLEHSWDNVEMVAPNYSFFPTTVRGFNIKPDTTAGADGALEVHFSMKFIKGDGQAELNEFMDSVENNPFDLSLMSIQGSLWDRKPGDAAGDGAAGGTKVDMSGGDAGQEEQPPPLVQAMMDGEKDLVDEAVRTGNSIASLREMAGGTTDDLKRAKREQTELHPVE